MPSVAFDPDKLGKRGRGRKFRDQFKGAGPKVRGTGAPKKFTGKTGNVTEKKARRAQKLTRDPMRIRGAAKGLGTRRMTGHSMGGMFGPSPKRTEPENRPAKQSEKRSDSAKRMKRLQNLLI